MCDHKNPCIPHSCGHRCSTKQPGFAIQIGYCGLSHTLQQRKMIFAKPHSQRINERSIDLSGSELKFNPVGEQHWSLRIFACSEILPHMKFLDLPYVSLLTIFSEFSSKVSRTTNIVHHEAKEHSAVTRTFRNHLEVQVSSKQSNQSSPTRSETATWTRGWQKGFLSRRVVWRSDQ